MTESIEFVNDWSELEAAIEVLKQDNPYDMDLGEWDCNSQHWSGAAEDAVDLLIRYVPRLLTQYASLLELSFTLTGSWEEYARLNPPSGLHLPDHR